MGLLLNLELHLNIYIIEFITHSLGSLARYQSMLQTEAEMDGRTGDAQSSAMSDLQSRHLVLQLAVALDHCHSKGVVHRNVSPRSVLLDTGCNLKLSGWFYSCLSQ